MRLTYRTEAQIEPPNNGSRTRHALPHVTSEWLIHWTTWAGSAGIVLVGRYYLPVRCGGKSGRRVWGISKWWHCRECICSRMADTSNRSLNDTTVFVLSIVTNISTEVRKQRGLRKAFFVFNKGRWLVVFHQVVPLCFAMKVNLTDLFKTLRHWSLLKLMQMF